MGYETQMKVKYITQKCRKGERNGDSGKRERKRMRGIPDGQHLDCPDH